MSEEITNQEVQTTLPSAEEINEAQTQNTEVDAELTEEEKSEKKAEKKEKKSGFEKRIQRLNSKADAAAAEAAHWKAEALRNHQQEAPTKQVDTSKPTLAQYGNDLEAYTDALTEYKLEQKEQVKKQSSVFDNYNKRAEEFKKSTPDFADVLEDANDVACAQEIHTACLDSEVGPQLAYYFAKNIDEVERINKLPAHRRLIEIGKLEDKLSKKSEEVVKTKKVVPAPATPVKGSGTPGSTSPKSIYEMSAQELMKFRNSQGRGNRRV